MCRYRAVYKSNVVYGGQLWYLLDPTGKRIQRINPSGVGLDKLRRDLKVQYGPEHQPPLDIWTKLIRYDNNTCPLGNVDDSLTSLNCQTLSQSSDLLQLPLETMWIIFDMLNPSDIVALASTCRTMFESTCSIIAREVRTSSGDLAGYPLAIVSGRQTLLPNFIGTYNLAHLSITARDQIDLRCPWTSPPGAPINYSWIARQYVAAAMSEYQPPKSQSAATNTWLPLLDVHRRTRAVTSRKSKRRFKGTKKPMTSEKTPEHEPAHNLLNNLLRRTVDQPCIFDKAPTSSRGNTYYLRNHTIHALIQVCTCPTPHISAHSNTSNPTHPLTLDDIFTVMTRNTISTPFPAPTDSLEIFEKGPWITGPWAGHCFDIVSASRHEREFPSSPHSQSDSTTSPIWRDQRSAVLVRAQWEYDRLHLYKQIATIKRKKMDSVSSKWAEVLSEAKNKAREAWIEYMDSLYDEVMVQFGGDGVDGKGDEEVVEMVGMWRRKFEGIVTECIYAQVDRRKVGSVESGLSVVKGQVGDGENGVSSGKKRKIEGEEEEKQKGKGKGKEKIRRVGVRQSKRLRCGSVGVTMAVDLG